MLMNYPLNKKQRKKKYIGKMYNSLDYFDTFKRSASVGRWMFSLLWIVSY